MVWLYNECGVISLVQGNLNDAVEQFRQALRLNGKVEGQIEGGMQHNRIALNLAVAQIERGRMGSATKRLNSICETEMNASGYEGRMWHLAHGYLGLVHHIAGDLDQARRNYRRAYTMLGAYEDKRGCSVFLRHCADAERASGNHKEAIRLCTEAIDFAAGGGHEDMRQKAVLSMIKAENAKAEAEGRPLNIDDIMHRLERVESYAAIMEMPGLTCEALHLRAQLLVKQGETMLAGSLLSRAMALAKRNGMRLRLNSALTAYAVLLGRRGMKEPAQKLLTTSYDMGKRNGNQLELRRIDEALALLG